MAAANAKKHKSKNRVTILQGLIEKNYFLNWVYLLQILIIAHIKTLTKEQGLHYFVDTKSLCYFEITK